MPKAKKLLSPVVWWDEILSGKRSYKKPADAGKAIGLLKTRGWKVADVERAKVLMEAYFRDPSKVPPTFYDATRKSGETAAVLTRTLKAAGKGKKFPPAAQVAAHPEVIQELTALLITVQARTTIIDAMASAQEKNIPGLDLSEMQSVVNDLIIDNERLRVLNGRHGAVVTAPAGKRTPVTKNAAPASPPPEERAAVPETTPEPQSQDNGHLKPPGFSGWGKKNTPHEREVFQRTRPKG